MLRIFIASNSSALATGTVPEANGRQTVLRLMLDARHRGVAGRTEFKDEGLRLVVVRYEHDEVDVTREPHLGANGHGEAADQSEASPTPRKLIADPRER